MRALLCAATAACLLGACGSDNHSSSSMTTAAAKPVTRAQRTHFVKKANALCDEFNAGVDVGVAIDPTNGSHIYESFFFEMRILAPRDKRLDAFIADGLGISDSYGELEDVVRERQGSAAFARAVAGIAKSKAKFVKAARANGIVACEGGAGFTPGGAIPRFH